MTRSRPQFYGQRESNLEGINNKTVRVTFLPEFSTLQIGGSNRRKFTPMTERTCNNIQSFFFRTRATKYDITSEQGDRYVNEHWLY